ncbi:MAG: Holliday junction resolvase RecU, partial [Gammaproteobacteria bacterium]|nr:Holliday junction resolvase RecU [Gammaproteobacteria bacterium]
MSKSRLPTSYANRGKWLERIVEHVCLTAIERGEAVIVKQETPYALPRVGVDGLRCLVRKRSTVDYIGVVGGIPIAFDAKSENVPRLPIRNVKKHQVDFLAAFARARGLACLLVAFGRHDVYLADIRWWIHQCAAAAAAGRKSVSADVFAAARPQLVVPVVQARGYVLDIPGAAAALALHKERE